MGQLKESWLRLNGYSWSIIIAFICAAFAMQFPVANVSFKDIFQVIPLIIVAIYWCQKSAHFISQPENNLKKSELFKRDLFLLSFSFLLASLISLLFAYDNSDARGWWVLIIYLFPLYGLLFSLTFSVIALLIKNHKIYTIIFALLIITFVSCGNFFLSIRPSHY